MTHYEPSNFTLFFKFFDRKNNMTDAQKRLIVDHLQVIHMDKKTHVLKAGVICKEIYFVVDGYCSSHYMDGKKNNTINFYNSGSFMTDIPCLTDPSPARWSILSHKKGILLSINIYTWRKLCDENPYINNAFFAVLFKQIEKLNRQALLLIGCTTEQSILHLKVMYPGILGVVPQTHLANYLKVTDQAMSSVIKHLK